MAKKRVMLIIVVFTFMLPSVYSLSLIGNKLSPILFEPGKMIVNHYTIEGTDREVEVSLGGDLLDYINITEVVDNQFDLIISVSESLLEFPDPGEYRFSLHATEVGSAEGDSTGIGSSVSVNLVFIVIVPPRGKEITVSLDIPDVNEQAEVPVSVHVESRGLEKISMVKAFVRIYDEENRSITSLNLAGRSLPALESMVLSSELPPSKLSSGQYRAEAIVNYDGEEKTAQDDFKIGNLDLILVNYSSSLEREFGEFWAVVENNWGNPIQTAYAVVYIHEEELLTTPTIQLGPWESDTLKGILRTDFQPGEYEGKIQLFYDGLSKEKEVIFTIFEPAKEKKISFSSIAIAVAVALMVLIICFISLFLRKKMRRSEE